MPFKIACTINSVPSKNWTVFGPYERELFKCSLFSETVQSLVQGKLSYSKETKKRVMKISLMKINAKTSLSMYRLIKPFDRSSRNSWSSGFDGHELTDSATNVRPNLIGTSLTWSISVSWSMTCPLISYCGHIGVCKTCTWSYVQIIGMEMMAEGQFPRISKIGTKALDKFKRNFIVP